MTSQSESDIFGIDDDGHLSIRDGIIHPVLALFLESEVGASVNTAKWQIHMIENVQSSGRPHRGTGNILFMSVGPCCTHFEMVNKFDQLEVSTEELLVLLRQLVEFLEKVQTGTGDIDGR
jgi:hypothetical protein